MGTRLEEMDRRGPTPGRVNLTALVSRFWSTEYIASGSARTTGSQPMSSWAPASTRSYGCVVRELVRHLAQVNLGQGPNRWRCSQLHALVEHPMHSAGGPCCTGEERIGDRVRMFGQLLFEKLQGWR